MVTVKLRGGNGWEGAGVAFSVFFNLLCVCERGEGGSVCWPCLMRERGGKWCGWAARACLCGYS